MCTHLLGVCLSEWNCWATGCVHVQLRQTLPDSLPKQGRLSNSYFIKRDEAFSIIGLFTFSPLICRLEKPWSFPSFCFPAWLPPQSVGLKEQQEDLLLENSSLYSTLSQDLLLQDSSPLFHPITPYLLYKCTRETVLSKLVLSILAVFSFLSRQNRLEPTMH